MGNIEATIGYLYYTKKDLEIDTTPPFNLTEDIGFYVGMAFVGITLGAIVGVIANLLSKRFCFKTREGNSASFLSHIKNIFNN